MATRVPAVPCDVFVAHTNTRIFGKTLPQSYPVRATSRRGCRNRCNDASAAKSVIT